MKSLFPDSIIIETEATISGMKNMTLYSTPFGTLQMGIAATGLEIMEDEDCIQMKVDYALDMNDEHVADCYLTVQAQSKDLGDFSFYEN